MNLINQKLFDFECDAYHDGELHEYQQKIF